MKFDNRVKESCSGIRCCVGILGGNEMCSFGRLIHDDKYHIPFSFAGGGEGSSEVHRNCMPSFGSNFQRSQESTWSLITSGFVSLAGSTCLTVCTNVTTHVIPEVSLTDIVERFGEAQMSGIWRIVVVVKNFGPRVVVVGYIDSG